MIYVSFKMIYGIVKSVLNLIPFFCGVFIGFFVGLIKGIK